MERRHTLGPWYRDDAMVEHGCCWAAAIVADVPKGEGQYGGTQALIAECDEENAPLILAAPDMLAALKLVEKRDAEGGVADCAVRAAIAKAEGRS